MKKENSHQVHVHVHVLPLRASADIDAQLEAAAMRRNLSVTNVKSILHVRPSRSTCTVYIVHASSFLTSASLTNMSLVYTCTMYCMFIPVVCPGGVICAGCV